MNPTEFLKLIGAPWMQSDSGCDFVRTTSDGKPVASVYPENQECIQDETGKARTQIIAAAPDLYAYAAAMAAQGDTQAKMLLQRIHGDTTDHTEQQA